MSQQDVAGEHDVLFIEDVAAKLRRSVRTIQRARSHGAFPIPELPPFDNRPTWSRKAVQEYLSRQKAPVSRGWRRRA